MNSDKKTIHEYKLFTLMVQILPAKISQGSFDQNILSNRLTDIIAIIINYTNPYKDLTPSTQNLKTIGLFCSLYVAQLPHLYSTWDSNSHLDSPNTFEVLIYYNVSSAVPQ